MKKFFEIFGCVIMFAYGFVGVFIFTNGQFANLYFALACAVLSGCAALLMMLRILND